MISSASRGPLGRLLVGWLLACTAIWIFLISLGVYAYDRSGATGVGVVTAARILPAAAGGILSGHLLDRFDRAKVVAVTCAIQSLSLACAGVLMIQHAGIGPIAALTAVYSVAGTTIRPGLQALLPALADSPQELVMATRHWSVVDNGGFLIGSAAGAGLVATAGPGAATVIAAGLVSAVALLLSAIPRTPTAQAGDADEVDPSDILAGAKVVASAPGLRVPFSLLGGLFLLDGLSDVMLVSLALGPLALGPAGPGVLYAVWGVGGLLGSAAILRLVNRRGYGLALSVGALALGGGLAIAGLDGAALAVCAMVPAGLGYTLVETSVTALVPRFADDTVIGRVYVFGEVLYAVAGGLGALLAPLIVRGIGEPAGLALVGGIYAVSSLLLWRGSHSLDREQSLAGRVRELLRGVTFLEPLPLPILERLVRRARLTRVDAGAAVVKRGDIGHAYFVIETGRADVVEVGRSLGPGDAFGEIALLREIPRTATVRAIEASDLWSIDGSTFRAAVTGHSTSRDVSDAVVAGHLASDEMLASPHK